jgi:predicted RNA binding protein YcfA (HicA-like mRNA interferase family)
MRLPRDISGQELIRLLARFGYVPTRQSGSHVRLTTSAGGEHHITVPRHDQLRMGTLAAIVGDVAQHAGLSRGDVADQLFGNRN